MANPIPQSAVIIEKNKGSRMASCIRSLEGVSDEVVLDSGSTDRAVALCRKLGTRVFNHPWTGLSHQQNWAHDKARRCLERLGFLESDTGFSVTAISTFGEFLKQAKIIELERHAHRR
jgi:hypothetical protein